MRCGGKAGHQGTGGLKKQVDKQDLSADKKAVEVRGYSSYHKSRAENKVELRLQKDGEHDEVAG